MTNDRRRVREAFIRIADLPRAERAAELARLGAADAQLGAEVEALLKADDSAAGAGFMSDPTHSEVANPPSAGTGALPLTERAGTQIGKFKLLQQIGEGGFGVVFMAEQERPVRRRVALKIIKLGMDTRQVVARFEQERQALALMDHPNIAKVLDGGATETGRPYFVMEYVIGDPITKFANDHRLSVPERLELFRQVCGAVQHAHQKGVIHRDLKPRNVLVSMVDGRPQARVIDFGIAKATGAQLTDKTLFTEHKQLIGTPEYMSPEQAEGSPDIDTRTDVYSLGVLLYELLSGATPIDGTRLRSAAFGEMQRIIKEEEPPAPSLRVGKDAQTLAATAAQRRVEPARLGTLIRGELDWIVMKALDKDRARRYESPSSLSQDVERHLTGEPVTAAPPTWSYRARKFVRKHRGPVAVGVGVGCAVLIGVAGTTWQWWRAATANESLVKANGAFQREREELVDSLVRTMAACPGYANVRLESDGVIRFDGPDGSPGFVSLALHDGDWRNAPLNFSVPGMIEQHMQAIADDWRARGDNLASQLAKAEKAVQVINAAAEEAVDRGGAGIFDQVERYPDLPFPGVTVERDAQGKVTSFTGSPTLDMVDDMRDQAVWYIKFSARVNTELNQANLKLQETNAQLREAANLVRSWAEDGNEVDPQSGYELAVRLLRSALGPAHPSTLEAEFWQQLFYPIGEEGGEIDTGDLSRRLDTFSLVGDKDTAGRMAWAVANALMFKGRGKEGREWACKIPAEHSLHAYSDQAFNLTVVFHWLRVLSKPSATDGVVTKAIDELDALVAVQRERAEATDPAMVALALAKVRKGDYAAAINLSDGVRESRWQLNSDPLSEFGRVIRAIALCRLGRIEEGRLTIAGVKTFSQTPEAQGNESWRALMSEAQSLLEARVEPSGSSVPPGEP